MGCSLKIISQCVMRLINKLMPRTFFHFSLTELLSCVKESCILYIIYCAVYMHFVFFFTEILPPVSCYL